MKKRIFALALALCMMVSVMPTSFANGVLTLGDGTDTGVLTLDNGTSGRSTTTSASVQPRQDGVLYNTSGSEGGQSDYDFGSDTDQTTTSMNINTGSSSGANSDVVTADVLSYEGKYPDTTNVDKTKSGIDTLTKTANVVGTTSAGESIVKIDMTAGTDSEITVTGAPCNIVLVLDASKTMKNDAATLKTAVDGFIDGVYENAPGSKIAVVGYAGSAIPYKGSNITTAANALQPVMVDKVDEAGNVVKDANGNVVKELNSDLKKATAAVQTVTAAEQGVQKRADAGLEMAVDILQAVPSTDTSKPIVILFTNGMPTDNVDNSVVWNTDAYGIAQDSIHWSVILKANKNTNAKFDFDDEFYTSGSKTDTNTQTRMNNKKSGCGATVYCVGVNLPKATRASSWFAEILTAILNGGGVTENGAGLRANEFMYRVSSHVPTGLHEDSTMGDYGYTDAKTRGKGYYMVAENMDALKSMFESIEIESGDTVSNVIYRDYIAPGFVPCDANGNPLSPGTQSDGTVIGVVTDDDDNILYYYVEKSNVTLNPGKDVTMSIYVKSDDHLGGKDVYTNIAGASGIYSGDTNIGSFPAPDVDIPIEQIIPDAQSFTIYLSNEADLAGLVKLDDRLDGKKNAGVSVTYTIMDGENPVASYTVAKGAVATEFPSEIVENLETCKAYKIVCTVDGDVASDSDSNYRKTGENAGTVHVVKPQLTFDDVNVYLGKTPVFDDEPVLTWVSTSNHVCGTPSGKVPDIKCTFVNSKAHYLADTTVTPTANLTGTGTPRSVVQKAFNVFVYAPVVTYQDTTIYLGENANFEKDPGETATANLVSTAWMHNGTVADTSKMGAAPELAFNYSEKETGMTDCTPVSVTDVGIDGNANMKVGETTYDYADFTTFVNDDDETEGVQFTVHVVKPVFSNTDTTIYLGNSVNLNGLMHEDDMWVCEDGEELAAKDATVKAAHTYTPGGNTTVSPKECTTYGVETKVAGNTVYTGEIDVHVIQPTITFEDQDIYLSQTPVYAEPDFAWDTTCSGEHSKIPAVSGTDTEDSFEYDYDNEPAAFTQCTDVDVTVWIDDVDYSAYVTLMNVDEERGAEVEEFTVHVYLPQIVLESQDLWADYDCDVTLTDGMKAPAITKWVDQCAAGEEKAHSNAAPQCSDPVYQFALNGSAITEYNAKTNNITDQATIDVALGNIKIGNIEYTFTDVEAVEYTITVNKFDLTISKTWNGADIYKQDAIFTVSGGLGDFQVVLPAGQESIEVTGLLCGQTYTVSEDEAWTWRWSAKQTDDITSHSHGVSTEAPTEHSDTSVTFENSLINRLWLSFCTFVQNIFGQAAIQKGGN